MSSYKQRNFDNHLESYRIDNIPDKDYESDSDLMHDRNRGVTHFYLPDTEDGYRIISDVEIAFSPDKSVTSLFSYDHRERLSHRVIASHRSSGMTDDVLADTIAGNASFERSEVSRIGDDLFRSISSVQSEFSDNPGSVEDPAASPDSSTD